MKNLTACAVLALAVLLTADASAQTVDDIIGQYVAATGGAANWAALQSLTVSSRSPYYSFDAFWKKPNRIRVDAWSDASPETDSRWFDGTAGWRLTSIEGLTTPRKMSAAEISELSDEFDWMLEFADYKAKGYKVRLRGVAAIEGRSANKLELTRPNGAVAHVFLDVKTGLEVRRVKWARSPTGEQIELDLPIGDYRNVGGLLLPHQVGPATRVYHVNPVIPDSRFARPPGTGASNSEQQFAERKVAAAAAALLPAGSVAPEWTLKDPQGQTRRLSDLRGHVVVMDFWATWCAPCHRVLPELQRLHEEFSPRGVVVLGISTSERGGNPAQLLRERGYTYGLLLNGEAIAASYHVIGMPVVYVIGADGTILHGDVGADEAAGAARRALVAQYLSAQRK